MGWSKRAVLVLALLALAKLLQVIREKKRQEAAKRRLQKCKEKGFRVAICGAGFSGLCLGIKLKKLGIPFVIFERNEDFGGTWLKNIYPDAACDIPSVWYSYSFERNWDWTRKWPKREEIMNYIKTVARKYKLDECARFNCTVESATLDATKGRKCWQIQYRDAKDESVQTEYFSVFLSAVGQLDEPKIPEFEGLETFKGPTFHTAQWDHSVDLTGKNVVGVGSGPSAIQAFPAIAPQCKSLTVLQRSPVWVIPKGDKEISSWLRLLRQYVPGVMALQRLKVFIYQELTFFTAIKLNSYLNIEHHGEKLCRTLMTSMMGPKAKSIKDKLIPTYPLGCKRIGLTDDWIPMFDRDNVQLETSPISKVTPTSIELQDGTSVSCDAIIFATGFKATQFLSTMDVRVKGGSSLHETWHGVAKAYKSMAVSGFPNMWMLYGPGSNLGHGSIIFMIECQTNYIGKLLEHMVDHDVDLMEVKQEAMDRDFSQNNAMLKHTTFTSPTCNSWYKTASGEVVTNWGGCCTQFWAHLHSPDLTAYKQ